MSDIPADLKYAKSHEWVRVSGALATIGITDHAQHELTDVVFVELPEAGHVRMLGNLLGDPMQEVEIGAEVEGVFEHHEQSNPAYTLMQWRRAG